MVIREIFEKIREKKRKQNEALEEARINKYVSDRMKSANERELDRFANEHREEEIKKMLGKFRKQNSYLNPGHNFNKQKNVFKGHRNILKEDKKILKTKGNFF